VPDDAVDKLWWWHFSFLGVDPALETALSVEQAFPDKVAKIMTGVSAHINNH
jgi:hypothetical protein